MGRHDPPRRSTFGNHQRANRRSRRLPPKFSRQVSAEARLRVQPAEGLLQIAQPALHLHDEERPVSRVSGDDIAPTSIAISIETHLDANDPAGPGKEFGNLCLDIGMYGIHEAIQPLPVPAHFD
jgi:hypothetical protein